MPDAKSIAVSPRVKDLTYGSWKGIIQRCCNPKSPAHHKYGGRGITVCERWRSFKAFYEDMGPRPSPLHSIERINNNGNYELGNCRWATRREQSRNTRQNVMLVFSGRTQCIAAWAEERGMKPKTLCRRLKCGWPVELAITAPLHHRPQSHGSAVER